MGTTWKRLAWVVVASVALSRGAVAESDELRALERADLDNAGLRAALTERAAGLAKDADLATKSGAVVVCSRDTAEARAALAAEIDGVMTKARDVLQASGWSVPAKPAKLTYVRVRVTGAPAARVFSDDGTAVVVREGDAVRKIEPPTPPTRPDGLPLARDAVAVGNRARVWALGVAGGGNDRPSAAQVAAHRAVAALVPAGSVPPWLEQGLRSWIETKATGGAPSATSHVCKPWLLPVPATLEQLAASKGAAPTCATAFLGRFVGVLLDGKADGGTAFFELARATGTLDAAVRANFGKSLSDVIAAAAPVAAPAPSASTPGAASTLACDDAGTIGCPACAGSGRFDVACAECAGTTATTCPSCLGSPSCQNCLKGWVYYADGGRAKCRYCAGGKTKCLACNGTLKAACKSCKGSGKMARTCIACTGGRMPCPAAAAPSATPPCPWCAGPPAKVACTKCSGAGYAGCGDCWGTLRQLCDGCIGTGSRKMVYEDGTTASVSKCDTCDGKGATKCGECKNGKLPCEGCTGSGREDAKPADCIACAGTAKLPEAEPSLLRARSLSVTKDDGEAHKKMLDDAVKFLLTCRKPRNGSFALRELRRGRRELMMPLEEPSAFANAMALWTLATAGRGKDDPELAGAWAALRAEGTNLAAGTADYCGAQATSLTLRALAMGGEDPKGALVKGLVDRLVKGQHGDGLWGGDLRDPKEESEVLDSLFVVEALRAARLKGAKVPLAVWSKVLRGATAQLEGRTLSGKTEWLGGTSVASATALVIMAKEGSLGSRATAYDYAAMPPVKRGMAWLDRHFDIVDEPILANGVKSPQNSDRGYMAWLFSIQRLGMLLAVEELGGERWYARGVQHLQSIQYADGSFEERSRSALNGAVRTTTGAILFLLRATPPITNSADDE